MSTTSEATGSEATGTAFKHDRGRILFAGLVGLIGLAVLLQGLWAGIFLEHDGERDAAGKWIDVHATGGEVAIALALAATVVAFVAMRSRRDLWIGSLLLVVILAIEAYLGGLIHDDSKDALTAVHIPLAMALMGLSAWLTARAARHH